MILGVDQVILDLVVNVDDDLGIFERYGIERNTQCLAEPRHMSLMNDLLARSMDEDGQGGGGNKSLPPVRKSPGGIVANSLRASMWSLRQTPGGPRPEVKFMGMIGRDSAGERMRRDLQTAGIHPLFNVKPASKDAAADPAKESTGVCCCLVAGKSRTMVTNLGAGNSMELHGKLGPLWPSFIAQVQEAMVSIQAGLPIIIVLAAFYVQADPEGCALIAEWCKQARQDGGPRPLIALTVAVEWCCNLPVIQEMAKTADFVFANEPEIVELAAALRRSGEIPPAAGHLDANAASDEALVAVSAWKVRGWTIATRGSKSVGLCRAGGLHRPLLVPVPKLPAHEFVDDVGAGDSFMGGFLASAWLHLANASSRAGREGDSAHPSQRKLGDVVGECMDLAACQVVSLLCCSRQDARAPPMQSRSRAGSAVSDSARLPPSADALSDADVVGAAKDGIEAAAACLRCVGCNFKAAPGRG